MKSFENNMTASVKPIEGVIVSLKQKLHNSDNYGKAMMTGEHDSVENSIDEPNETAIMKSNTEQPLT